MQVINLSEPYNKNLIPAGPVVLALGFFDGVHRGHQRVIKKAQEIAYKKDAKLAVMTFDRYPKIAYKSLDPTQVRYLTLLDRKLELFAEIGVDITYVVEFNQNLVPMSPQDFVDKYIFDLHVVTAVAGFDFTYGKASIANMQMLPQYANGRFDVYEVPELQESAEKVGSTQIKSALDHGEIEKVNNLLGYPFEISGVVVHGEARGRQLGFPTINVKSGKQQKLPTIGVYAVKVEIDHDWFDGMASVSRNETFGPDRGITVEINLFDVQADFYDKKVRVQWFKYLRPSVKFSGAAELVDQMKKDEKNSREILKKKCPIEALK